VKCSCFDSGWKKADEYKSVAKNQQNRGMTQLPSPRPLPMLAAGEEFPAVGLAWGASDPAPGLLAAGSDLSAPTLHSAYRQGIFPWYSEGQPILWWSPDPRMVLHVEHFKLHRSLRKTILRFLQTPGCEIRVDCAFAQVIAACANAPRQGQRGTWILPPMQTAYIRLHEAGLAHSVETWQSGQLVGGLYCTALGAAVFGESMFARQTDASKIALAALVALCRAQGVRLIDCQQNTSHLASLGAREMPREQFCSHVQQAALDKPLHWESPYAVQALVQLLAESVKWNGS
jgi:leucyl/phenylalanyl-tRNA---protein transferase